MTLSKKEVKIISLMTLDTVFFLLEIIIGYLVNSLALIADSFHMLNDIISLSVALWAVNVAKNRVADAKFTYGWLRAEILGALVNGVFLVALCFTIFIEAIQRFIQPPVITNPKLILFVGTIGLISNIVGLFLFHDTEHAHGNSHEEGHHHVADLEANTVHDGNERAHLQQRVASSGMASSSTTSLLSQNYKPGKILGEAGDDSDIDSILPAAVVKKLGNYGATVNSLALQAQSGADGSAHANGESNGSLRANIENRLHKQNEKQRKPRSLNMHGVFLHVFGDCLGNIGVMVTALLIWKTDYSWRFYFDPAVSLVITFIIFSTAVPLCKSSSRILLQGSPVSVDSDEVKNSILSIPEVISVHDFHIWNLTETYLIATMHVDLNCSPERFLTIAANIKSHLHNFGIHNATIQPEFSNYYAREHMLPKRYSSSQNLPAQAMASDSVYNATGNGSSENLIHPGSHDSFKHSATDGNKSINDLHCMVDACANCTTSDCIN